MAVVQHLLLAAREHFPNLDLSNVGPAGEMNSVRGEGHTDRPVMVVLILPEQRHQLGAGGDFPNLNVFVMAAARKHETVGRKRKAADVMIVACEQQFHRLAGLAVP